MSDHPVGRRQTTGSERLKDPPTTRSIAIASLVVLVVAIALRMPSCYESFWVDELHSAWCVWDGLGDVAPRADIGHQSPFYFVALWFWKQIVGETELALRFSSVLAVSASCVVLTVGVARWSRSWIAGWTAGMVLAIESNSIFFGTELRPFAAVILFASIATICFARLIDATSRHDQRGAWIGMILAILAAGLCQPTSLGVLSLLPIVLACRWIVGAQRRRSTPITLTDGLLLLTTTAVGFALWSMTLSESWGQRQTWDSFASARSIEQILQAWDWVALWCLPILVLLGGFVARPMGSDISSRSTWMLAVVAASATLGYWTVAWMEWLPLWHRRYFIAVLPMFAFIAGGSVAVVANRDRVARFAPLVSIALLGCLAFRQQLPQSLVHYPVALVVRGEDWRGAIASVRDRAEPDDRIYVESGLIESRRWLDYPVSGFASGPVQRASDPTPEQLTYLRYPVLGPYRLDQRVEVVNTELDLPLQVLYDNRSQIFLIVRRPASQIEIDPTKWGWVHGNRIPNEVKSFGNVTTISFTADDQGR